MKRLKYFMQCYFNMSFGFDDLDKRINDFKEEVDSIKEELIRELDQIIVNKDYVFANTILKNGELELDNIEEVKLFINYLHDKLLDRPTTVKAKDFKKKYKLVWCPVCVPEPEKAELIILIEKATVIGKNIQIYICKECKLMWLDENNIKTENAQDYKKFMKANGFKGLWDELKDVDIL